MAFCIQLVLALLMLLVETAIAADIPKQKAPTMADVLAASKPGDWRALDPQRTLYVELASGRVVIELAPNFAPRHVATSRRWHVNATTTDWRSSVVRITTWCSW